MKRLNAIFLYCRAKGWTISRLSRETGINRTRLHRLAHAQNLRSVLTVSEALAISATDDEYAFDW